MVGWGEVSGAIGYRLTFAPLEGACEGVEGGVVELEAGDVTSHTLKDLEEFTGYSVVVQSRGSEGVGATSSPEEATTFPNGTAAHRMFVVLFET